MRWTRLLICIVVLAAALRGRMLAQAGPTQRRTVTLEEAKQLIFRASEDEGATKLPHFTLQEEPDDPDLPDFYNFSALWRNPDPGGSAVIGYYTVDRATGDVWSADECKEFRS